MLTFRGWLGRNGLASGKGCLSFMQSSMRLPGWLGDEDGIMQKCLIFFFFFFFFNYPYLARHRKFGKERERK